tara:strand:+ start:14543 stop:15289 length:747 start_codon:yes stop_codon:yes gene_type:complete
VINYKLPKNFNLNYFEEVDSTMLKLKKLASEGAKIGTIVSAKKQTQGRGRHGREWISPEGNLYFSFLRRAEEYNSGKIFAPVFITSIALAKTILIFSSSIDLKLKWPNDVLINNSKVAGILIESFKNNQNIKLLNIGVGINIVSNPSDTLYPSTNLLKEGISISSEEVLKCFFNCLNLYENILVNKGIGELFKIWNEYTYKIGTKISVKLGENNIQGAYNGIDEKGSLLLRKNDGKVIKIVAGEVFVL